MGSLPCRPLDSKLGSRLEASVSINSFSYTILPGDSVERIAARFGVTAAALTGANTIRAGGLIHPGEVLTIPGTRPEMTIDRSRRLPADQFVGEKQAKDLIVLHFTAGGSVEGAYQSWLSTQERVATAYLVDLDGHIYEVFDPTFWACHLGVAAAHNPGYRQDKRSIGIEIVNWGGLKLDPGEQLNCWPKQYRTRYCGANEKARYVGKSFRGIDYFAAFPEAQQAAVCRLTRSLCDQFAIPKQIPSDAQRDRLDWSYYENYKGVASHQNFHAEKTDIGPAFDWERLRRVLAE